MDSNTMGVAPEWQVEQWFNTDGPLTLAGLRGKVVVVEAFQMLCPGCVIHGLPQTVRVSQTFPRAQVEVIGIHTVFEHHAAMTPVALEIFLHEFRIPFPVAVDKRDPGETVPRTMVAYGMQGTPTLLLIDALANLRYQHLGQISDLLLGAQIMELICEANALKESPQVN